MSGHSFIGLAACLTLAATNASALERVRTFQVTSSDGVIIRGQADLPARKGGQTAVVMVAGTGAFDRDAAFGPATLGERRKLFKDLAARLNARGVAAVRYDKRGVGYDVPRDRRVDATLVVTATTDAMRDDLRAVYDWTRSPGGLGARCVVVFAHSEGMAHVGRLADSGAPPPMLVVGMGALMDSPKRNFRWNFAERDEHSLRLMDSNKDGRTTNEEVRTSLKRTPAAVNGTVEPYLHPSGAWAEADLLRLRGAQSEVFEQVRAATLAVPDAAPWPDAASPTGVFQWWKSWQLDDKPIARRLAAWPTPVSLHYGDLDSQTHAPNQLAQARTWLSSDRLTFAVHPGRGHSLGEDVTFGPMDPHLADRLADEMAAAAKSCH